eukprot:6213224-Pleurochrysis_carterae.AAC.3
MPRRWPFEADQFLALAKVKAMLVSFTYGMNVLSALVFREVEVTAFPVFGIRAGVCIRVSGEG